MTNQRKSKRVACLVPVEGKAGGAFDHAATLDFSKEGVGFISEKKIPLHKKVTIALDLGLEEDPIFVRGKVQWVKPMAGSDKFRIGIFFSDFLNRSRSKLKQYFYNLEKGGGDMVLKNQTAAERRIFERFDSPFPAKFKNSKEDYGANLCLTNASAKGARLVSKTPLHSNDIVELEVKLPKTNNKPMEIEGQVVWAKKMILTYGTRA